MIGSRSRPPPADENPSSRGARAVLAAFSEPDEFIAANGLPHPLQITPQYVQERSQWCIKPCSGCGGDQTLDPKARFPDAPAGAIPIGFTSFCPCGGTMELAMIDPPDAPAASSGGTKPWWKFW